MNKIKPPISDKEKIREEVQHRISFLSEKEKEKAAKIVCKKLTRLPEVQNATQIYVYQSFDDEICLDFFIEWSISENKQIFVPFPAKQKWGFGGQTVWAGWKVIWGWNKIIASFCPLNAFGTFGDKSTKNDSEVVSIRSVILVPWRAFTLSGKRIGRGGGWYDRFLWEHQNFYAIGVCFDCQIFPDLVQEEHDISMDSIITWK